jgi:hypothetical protein
MEKHGKPWNNNGKNMDKTMENQLISQRKEETMLK